MITGECPFCGAGTNLCETKLGLDSTYFVQCSRCKARGPISREQPAYAERRWDARVAPRFEESFNKVFGEQP